MNTMRTGRQPSLDSDIIESTSVIADDAVNQFNNYETPVSEIGPIVLDEMTVVPQSTTSATVNMPEVYHPYLIAPKTYQYTSPTFYHLIHILQIPR